MKADIGDTVVCTNSTGCNLTKGSAYVVLYSNKWTTEYQVINDKGIKQYYQDSRFSNILKLKELL